MTTSARNSGNNKVYWETTDAIVAATFIRKFHTAAAPMPRSSLMAMKEPPNQRALALERSLTLATAPPRIPVQPDPFFCCPCKVHLLQGKTLGNVFSIGQRTTPSQMSQSATKTASSPQTIVPKQPRAPSHYSYPSRLISTTSQESRRRRPTRFAEGAAALLDYEQCLKRFKVSRFRSIESRRSVVQQICTMIDK